MPLSPGGMLNLLQLKGIRSIFGCPSLFLLKLTDTKGPKPDVFFPMFGGCPLSHICHFEGSAAGGD
jgi:hypothetical protein